MPLDDALEYRDAGRLACSTDATVGLRQTIVPIGPSAPIVTMPAETKLRFRGREWSLELGYKVD